MLKTLNNMANFIVFLSKNVKIFSVDFELIDYYFFLLFNNQRIIWKQYGYYAYIQKKILSTNISSACFVLFCNIYFFYIMTGFDLFEWFMISIYLFIFLNCDIYLFIL